MSSDKARYRVQYVDDDSTNGLIVEAIYSVDKVDENVMLESGTDLGRAIWSRRIRALYQSGASFKHYCSDSEEYRIVLIK